MKILTLKLNGCMHNFNDRLLFALKMCNYYDKVFLRKRRRSIFQHIPTFGSNISCYDYRTIEIIPARITCTINAGFLAKYLSHHNECDAFVFVNNYGYSIIDFEIGRGCITLIYNDEEDD